MKIKKFSRNFPRSRKFIPAEFLNGPIRKSLYSRKLILALGDRESLSPRNLVPAKVYTNKVKAIERKMAEQYFRDGSKIHGYLGRHNRRGRLDLSSNKIVPKN